MTDEERLKEIKEQTKILEESEKGRLKPPDPCEYAVIITTFILNTKFLLDLVERLKGKNLILYPRGHYKTTAVEKFREIQSKIQQLETRNQHMDKELHDAQKFCADTLPKIMQLETIVEKAEDLRILVNCLAPGEETSLNYAMVSDEKLAEIEGLIAVYKKGEK